MPKELLKIKHQDYVLSETVIDHKFYFHKQDYSEFNEIDSIVEICYNKYLVEKIRMGEIINYENTGMEICIVPDSEQKIAKVEVKGINITKDEVKVKQKQKSRFRF